MIGPQVGRLVRNLVITVPCLQLLTGAVLLAPELRLVLERLGGVFAVVTALVCLLAVPRDRRGRWVVLVAITFAPILDVAMLLLVRSFSAGLVVAVALTAGVTAVLAASLLVHGSRAGAT